jgi:hypothetical protein
MVVAVVVARAIMADEDAEEDEEVTVEARRQH